MVLKFFIDLIARFGQMLSDAGWQVGMVRLTTTLCVLLCLCLFAWGLYWLTRLVFSRVVCVLATKYKNKLGDILLRRHVVRSTSYMLFCVIFCLVVPSVFDEFPGWIIPLRKLLAIGVLFFLIRAVTGVLWSVVDYQAEYGQNRQRSFKGIVQFVTIILYFVGGIILLSILLEKSPLVFIGGLGAASAVLMLIFRDSILGLVAGAQLSYNDIVRIGDWISMPKFGADGIVTDITLTTVKVQNFDLTITTIPAYNLISDSVQNWRNMSELQHRRIQRSFNVDVTSIRFCEQDYLQRLAQNPALAGFMKPYAESPCRIELPNGGLTNVYLFRKYLEFYLSNHPDIDQQTEPEYTFMVRQLAMADSGLPIQLYCFTRTSEWAAYEKIQAEIFDHLLAMAPVFDIGIFERTTQQDHRIDRSRQ